METLKKLFTNFKKHSKIYIAFAMIITCVFGVMFATNTFAYNTTDNYNITNTIENITNYNFGNMEYKTLINGNKTKQYIELQRTSNNNVLSFNVKNDYLTDINYNNYTLFINYDYGWYRNGTWFSYKNGANVFIKLSLYINSSQLNTTTQYLYNNMLNETTFNYSYRTNSITNNSYTDIISSSTTFNLEISQQSGSQYYLRIYNIDFVYNNDTTFSYYYDNIYQQYNQLLEDYEDLETDYYQLNNDYTQLETDYNDLDEDYIQLQNDYDELERNRLQILSAFDGCSVQLFDNSNNLIMSEDLTLPSGANYINFDNFPNIKNYLSNYENNTYFYLIFNLNYSINNSLLFTFNNSVLEVDITISSTLNTFVETKSNMFNNANLYQLVINENYNSFNKIKFDGIYTPDYWNNLNISITIDGASYQNGYRDGLHEAEIYQGLYDDLLSRFRELQNQYNELLNHSHYTYDDGYNDGFNDAINNDFTTSGLNTLFNAILSYPVNFIKEVFNFNFMGVNISGVITFILSIGIVAFIINYFRKH